VRLVAVASRTQVLEQQQALPTKPEELDMYMQHPLHAKCSDQTPQTNGKNQPVWLHSVRNAKLQTLLLKGMLHAANEACLTCPA
jgi:hypothetical protein